MYEEQEPTDEEYAESATERAVASNKEIRIEGLTREDIHATLRAMVLSDYNLREAFDSEVESAVAKMVESHAQDVVRTMVAAETERVFREGIPEFDSYSGKVRSRRSVEQLVVDCLSKTTERGYDNRGKFLDVIVKQMVQEVFNDKLKSEIETAKKALRQQIDEVMSAHMVKGLREALGIR